MQFWSEGRNIDPLKPHEKTRLDRVDWFVVVQVVFASQWCCIWKDEWSTNFVLNLQINPESQLRLNWILCRPLPGSCRRPSTNVQLWESVEPAPAGAALPWSHISGFGKHWESWLFLFLVRWMNQFCLPVGQLGWMQLDCRFVSNCWNIIQGRCERHVFFYFGIFVTVILHFRGSWRKWQRRCGDLEACASWLGLEPGAHVWNKQQKKDFKWQVSVLKETERILAAGTSFFGNTFDGNRPRWPSLEQQHQ